jgi:predicted transcriptional regulator
MAGNSKRTRVDIIMDMLRVISEKNGQIKPTHLMYKSNLSHVQMKQYLDEMKSKGLVNEVFEGKKESDRAKKQIAITKKGRDFLVNIIRMKEFEKTFGL